MLLCLSINAFDYNCHVDLIKLLRQEGKLHRLRKARQKMSELFPLTEEIWLDWLKDEIGLTEGEEAEREKIYDLFEKAVKDYICPDIWLEYAQYSIGGMGASGGMDRARAIFERALTAVGLHMTKGAALWEAYREFEIAILSTLQLVSEPPKLGEYQSYIDYEMKEGDPARVQIVFERALTENCLVPDLWAKYTAYLDRQLKIKELVLSCHERAVRNCPWTMGLWKSYLLALERHKAEHHTVSDVFEKALSAGFIQATDYVEIWQSYLDYLRRRVDFKGSRELEELRAAFSRSLDYLKQDVEERFSESGDLSCTIMQIWARIEALHCKNMQKARELWDSIMTKGNAKYANMWLEYYNLERSYGDAVHCRKALHRAVQCTSDYPEHVCEVLLTFERVEGSLEDWDAAVQKTESRLNRVQEQRAKVAEREALIAQQEEDRAEQRRKVKAEKKAQKKNQKSNRMGDKRKAEDKCEDEWGEETEEQMETERVPPPFRPEPPGAQRNQQATSAFKMPDAASFEQRKDSNSVFVSNLSFNLEDPEDKMRDAFKGCGTVVQVRPVFTAKGAFRGYCYVQFEDELAVQEALKLDRQEVGGRPMFVSPCVDKSKNPEFKVFRYNTSMEKHKIFISGLPFTCTKEKLEELCREHGTVKAVRLVTNRSGKPKGLAYVEFENEAQASQAVLKMDRTKLDSHTLSVAISNPPARNLDAKVTPGRVLGAMMPRQLQGARGKGRTQVSLLPRSLHRQNTPEAKAENGTTTKEQDSMSDGMQAGLAASGVSAPAKPMSNEDFARLLLKK
uniref:RRM domain-containing protein n=1 Tax=Electrophorus electricus TaxID=8005 RepID=A0AAY5EE78_ELEEL